MNIDFASLKKQFQDKGLKMTRPRQAILEVLLHQPAWVTARDLYNDMAAQQRHIDFSTICRNLDVLTASGLLCRVDRDNNGIFAYRIREMKEHHHHIICRSCGKITPMEFCPLEQMSACHAEGFSELECRFEVYGTCQECQSK